MSEEKVQAIYKVTDTGIYGFFKEHRFLSNFHIANVVYEDIEYPSNEAAYQAAKIFFPHNKLKTNIERGRFATFDPSRSKKEGQLVQIRSDWEEVKEQVMLDINRIKFNTHPDLRELLLATGDRYLEETNWWKDRTWGVYMSEGKNLLGKVLMTVRSELLNSLIL